MKTQLCKLKSTTGFHAKRIVLCAAKDNQTAEYKWFLWLFVSNACCCGRVWNLSPTRWRQTYYHAGLQPSGLFLLAAILNSSVVRCLFFTFLLFSSFFFFESIYFSARKPLPVLNTFYFCLVLFTYLFVSYFLSISICKDRNLAPPQS